MQRPLAHSLVFALTVNGGVALAQSQPEVIARSGPAPVVVSQATYRAQKDDKAAPPLAPSDAGNVPLPTPTPLPPASSPMIVSGPGGTTMPSAPCTNCATPTAGPSMVASQPSSFFTVMGGPCQNRWYVTGEYLYWWVKDSDIPPLVTTGPTTDPLPGSLDPRLGPNTQVLFGNESLNTQGRSGARFEFGRWFGACQPWAIEGGFFFLGQRTTSFTASGNGSVNSPIIARPFFEANRQFENVEYVNFPGVLRGTINVNSTSDFWGAHVDWRRKLWCNPCFFRVDGQLGVRYLHFDEDLSISEDITTVATVTAGNGAAIPIGTRTTIQDNFKVDNDFVGGMIGLVTQRQRGPWNIELLTRVSLGNNHQRVEISDAEQVSPAVVLPPGNFNGGLLTRPSNIGSYTTDTFAVVPEVGLNVGYQFGPHWRIFAGYSFLYWSNMVRAGDQVDRTVNLTGIPFALQPGQTDRFGTVPAGTPRPSPVLSDTDFWAQGVNVGFQWTW